MRKTWMQLFFGDPFWYIGFVFGILDHFRGSK